MASVTDLITNARTDADVLIQTGNAFLEVIKDLATFEINVTAAPSLVNLISAGQGMGAEATAATNEVIALRPVKPVYPDVEAQVPNAPTVSTPSAVEVEEVPSFDGAAPALDLPVLPSVTMPVEPGSAPSFNAPQIPDAPTTTLPVAPTFDTITFPEPPAISVETFDRSLVTGDIIIPSTEFVWAEEAYQSDLLDEVKAKLLSDLTDGSYGIETTDEVRIWSRARDRLAQESAEQFDKTIREHAALGWPKPSGALAKDIERIRQSVYNKNSELNNEVAVKRAELFNETRKFTIEQVRQLENMLLQYHGSVQERALNAAKVTVEMSLALFDASVKKYNYDLEVYKVEASVFEAKIRAMLARAEIFRAQISAVEAQVGVQRNQVEVYRAQLAGVESVVSIYKTRMDAANVQATIERTRLDGFRAQVEAFVAQVQAKVAEFNLYEAKIKGEMARVTAFEAEINAHKARVEVVKTRADIDVSVMRANMDRARIQLEAYNSDIQRYKSQLDLNIAQVNATNTEYAADISAYNAEISALLKTYDLKVAGNNLFLEAAKADIMDKIERAKLRYTELLNSAGVRMKAGEYGADLIKNMIGSSLNTINTLAAQVESI